MSHNSEDSEKSPDMHKYQKYGRNINSNIYNHMVKRIMLDDNYRLLVKKVLEKNQYNITEEQFYELMSKKLGKIKDYISLNKMKKLFQGTNSRQIMGFSHL